MTALSRKQAENGLRPGRLRGKTFHSFAPLKPNCEAGMEYLRIHFSEPGERLRIVRLFLKRFLAGLDTQRAFSKLCQIAPVRGWCFRAGRGDGNSAIAFMRWRWGGWAFRLRVVSIAACVNGHGVYFSSLKLAVHLLSRMKQNVTGRYVIYIGSLPGTQ